MCPRPWMGWAVASCSTWGCCSFPHRWAWCCTCPLLQANAWAITAALVLSVVATVAVTALVLKLFANKDRGAMNNTLPPISDIWVYLSGSPLLALVLTLSAYLLGLTLYERSQRNPLAMANPVLIAVLVVCIGISMIDMPYAQYFEGAQFVHFLLGTATVSLAIPIYKGFASLKGRMGVLLLSLMAGGITSVLTAVGIARWLGVDEALVRGLVAKSGHRADCHGHCRACASLAHPDRHLCGEHRHLGCCARPLCAGRLARDGLVATRFCLGCGRTRHRHITRFQCERRGRGLCQLGMGLHGIAGAVLIPYAVAWWF